MMRVTAASPGRDTIKVDYGLRQATFEQIKTKLVKAGLVLRGGPQRWRRSLWKFTEVDEIGNEALSADGACRNRPPTLH